MITARRRPRRPPVIIASHSRQASRISWLADRVAKGSTVIMTTHILEIAERMADRIGVISSGRLVAEGTLTELRQQNGRTDTSLEDVFIALVDSEAAAA